MSKKTIEIVGPIGLEAKGNVELPNSPRSLKMYKSNSADWLPQIPSFLQIYNEQMPWIAWANRSRNAGLEIGHLINFLSREDNYVQLLVKDNQIIGWGWIYRNFTDFTRKSGKSVSLKPNQAYISKWFIPKQIRLTKKYKNLPAQWIHWFNNDCYENNWEGVAYIDDWNKNVLKACLRSGWKIKKWINA